MVTYTSKLAPWALLLEGIAGVAILIVAGQALAQDSCPPLDETFAKTLGQSLQVSKGVEQQRAAAVAIDAVNACGGNPAVVRILFEQAGKSRDPQAIVALASILNVAKTPWNVGDAAAQATWRAKFYDAYKKATDDFSKTALNGALMNSEGMYRQGVSKLPVAKPGTPEFDTVRTALESTLKFPDSPNYDDAKYLLAELKIRELIAARLGVMSGRSAEKALFDARTYLTELVNKPGSNPPKYTMYGYWNLALLELLTGNKEEGTKLLGKMRDTYNNSLNDPNQLMWNHTLYYYRAFHYSDFNVINNHITAGELYTRWTDATKAWPAGTDFTGSDGPAKLASEIEKVFKDTKTYFISAGVFATREAAQKKQSELAASGIEGLMVYPPWPERNVYTVGTGLQTLAAVKREVQETKLPKGSPVTRFY
jgi:hypothetical protein